jgi:hypothetical protein
MGFPCKGRSEVRDNHRPLASEAPFASCGDMVRIYEGIYEGTNQIERMVIARKTFSGVR